MNNVVSNINYSFRPLVSGGCATRASVKHEIVTTAMVIRTNPPNVAKKLLASPAATKIFTRSINVLASNRFRPSVKKGASLGSTAPVTEGGVRGLPVVLGLQGVLGVISCGVWSWGVPDARR